MNLTINGGAADITLENEKTVGELLAALEKFLEGSGHIMSGFSVDGVSAGGDTLEDLFAKNLGDTNEINVVTSSLHTLLAEALALSMDSLKQYGDASPENRPAIQDKWLSQSAASFLEHRAGELYAMIRAAFGGTGLSPAGCAALLAERREELCNPRAELAGMAEVVEETAKRLEDLPLDLQTGKDDHARETIQLFSAASEKLLRIISYTEGARAGEKTVDGTPAKTFLADFSAAVRELAEAYGNRDAVLAGDLAEYELAPRFRSLYSAFSGGEN
ncbi:MAG: hypothetical protein LBH73_08775 [Spirochaetaceae bacterium]|jgi:hypothetical protein|nr:hypothetical protein [Spirochaetaceae bacterium]